MTSRRRAGERGMVTAELATIAPFAVAFAFLLLWVVSLGLSQVRVTDAAREAARLVARGEATATAVQAAEQLAPDGAKVTVKRHDGVVTVRVEVRSGPSLPVWTAVGSRQVVATSVAVMEEP